MIRRFFPAREKPPPPPPPLGGFFCTRRRFWTPILFRASSVPCSLHTKTQTYARASASSPHDPFGKSSSLPTKQNTTFFSRPPVKRKKHVGFRRRAPPAQKQNTSLCARPQKQASRNQPRPDPSLACMRDSLPGGHAPPSAAAKRPPSAIVGATAAARRPTPAGAAIAPSCLLSDLCLQPASERIGCFPSRSLRSGGGQWGWGLRKNERERATGRPRPKETEAPDGSCCPLSLCLSSLLPLALRRPPALPLHTSKALAPAPHFNEGATSLISAHNPARGKNETPSLSTVRRVVEKKTMASLGVASRQGAALARPAARGLPRMTPVVRVAGGRNFNLKVRDVERTRARGTAANPQQLFSSPLFSLELSSLSPARPCARACRRSGGATQWARAGSAKVIARSRAGDNGRRAHEWQP